ncbi:MAG TPA: hypothetical protein PLC89_11160 [Haliscomenobacter sp.]|uniref:hypothetical protein n=1 Tax=Haliscomenobacter sp. TaxID=2717303 RepID=UPI002CB000C9|nr:hypothetical protein [Haliscomenobacter sp.]HOY17849.1 hypothetical protein [Haliscomenobacter sp.]HPH18381.1 hypothetical protein [Haliscomenobacter sp.]
MTALKTKDNFMLSQQDLHLKHVLGESLSPEELHQLEKWYEEQDAQEETVLHHSDLSADSPEQIQHQINLLLEQISTELEQVRRLTEENNALKNANQVLKIQLFESLKQSAA